MIVVILARTVGEGRTHARLAGLADRDVVIPGSWHGLEGLRLGAGDLIVEMPGFVGRRQAAAIRDALQTQIDRRLEDDRPLWHVVES